MPKALVNRNRFIYGSLTIFVLLMGFASRQFWGQVPFVRLYVGDALWAFMVYMGFATMASRSSGKMLIISSLGVSFGIELSQLYHAPWLDALRATHLGGLILGFVFLWSDLLCYIVGVGFGALIDRYMVSVGCRLRKRFE